MSSKEHQRGLSEKGKRIAREIGKIAEEQWEILESLSPESPDGLLSKFDLEASKSLGGEKALVFKTDSGYFFEDSDEYIDEKVIKKRAPGLLEKPKPVATF